MKQDNLLLTWSGWSAANRRVQAPGSYPCLPQLPTPAHGCGSTESHRTWHHCWCFGVSSSLPAWTDVNYLAQGHVTKPMETWEKEPRDIWLLSLYFPPHSARFPPSLCHIHLCPPGGSWKRSSALSAKLSLCSGA